MRQSSGVWRQALHVLRNCRECHLKSGSEKQPSNITLSIDSAEEGVEGFRDDIFDIIERIKTHLLVNSEGGGMEKGP